MFPWQLTSIWAQSKVMLVGNQMIGEEGSQAITPLATSPLKVCLLGGSGSYWMTYTTFPASAG